MDHRQAQQVANEDADELVVEVLEAKIAERFGPRDDTPPELLLGRVGIPLRTVYSHVASEGWHNLVRRNRPSVSSLREVVSMRLTPEACRTTAGEGRGVRRGADRLAAAAR